MLVEARGLFLYHAMPRCIAAQHVVARHDFGVFGMQVRKRHRAIMSSAIGLLRGDRVADCMPCCMSMMIRAGGLGMLIYLYADWQINMANCAVILMDLMGVSSGISAICGAIVCGRELA
jgi:hypothetical protein